MNHMTMNKEIEKTIENLIEDLNIDIEQVLSDKEEAK